MTPRARPVQREHHFQAWADRLIDRIVTAPMFVTGIDHAHTDMQHIQRRAKLQGRGIKFGIPDVFVAQCTPWQRASVWLELKRGSGVSATQEGVHVAMRRAGQIVVVCQSMGDIVRALRQADFALHGNADAIALEYEARLDAAETAPRVVRSGAARKPKARPDPGVLRVLSRARARGVMA